MAPITLSAPLMNGRFRRGGIQLTAAQIKAIRNRESLLSQKEEEIKRLEAEVTKLSAQASQAKGEK